LRMRDAACPDAAAVSGIRTEASRSHCSAAHVPRLGISVPVEAVNGVTASIPPTRAAAAAPMAQRLSGLHPRCGCYPKFQLG
jgi:hypothetical protein